jgi:hypothetical protein
VLESNAWISLRRCGTTSSLMHWRPWMCVGREREAGRGELVVPSKLTRYGEAGQRYCSHVLDKDAALASYEQSCRGLADRR